MPGRSPYRWPRTRALFTDKAEAETMLGRDEKEMGKEERPVKA